MTAALMTVAVVLVWPAAACPRRATRPTTPPSAASGTTAPPLADVTSLDDVRDWDGEVTAVAETPVDPVSDARARDCPSP